MDHTPSSFIIISALGANWALILTFLASGARRLNVTVLSGLTTGDDIRAVSWADISRADMQTVHSSKQITSILFIKAFFIRS